jgi:hypothetical protein
MANWFRIPTDGRPFFLFARSYEPKADLLNGAYRAAEGIASSV